MSKSKGIHTHGHFHNQRYGQGRSRAPAVEKLAGMVYHKTLSTKAIETFEATLGRIASSVSAFPRGTAAVYQGEISQHPEPDHENYLRRRL